MEEVALILHKDYALAKEEVLARINCFWSGIDLRDNTTIGNRTYEYWAEFIYIHTKMISWRDTVYCIRIKSPSS